MTQTGKFGNNYYNNRTGKYGLRPVVRLNPGVKLIKDASGNLSLDYSEENKENRNHYKSVFTAISAFLFINNLQTTNHPLNLKNLHKYGIIEPCNSLHEEIKLYKCIEISIGSTP